MAGANESGATAYGATLDGSFRLRRQGGTARRDGLVRGTANQG